MQPEKSQNEASRPDFSVFDCCAVDDGCCFGKRFMEHDSRHNFPAIRLVSSGRTRPDCDWVGGMMNEQEKAAYILGLKGAIEQIEAELDCVGMQYENLPLLLGAATTALMNAALLVEDQIAMTDGTRETKDK